MVVVVGYVAAAAFAVSAAAAAAFSAAAAAGLGGAGPSSQTTAWYPSRVTVPQWELPTRAIVSTKMHQAWPGFEVSSWIICGNAAVHGWDGAVSVYRSAGSLTLIGSCLVCLCLCKCQCPCGVFVSVVSGVARLSVRPDVRMHRVEMPRYGCHEQRRVPDQLIFHCVCMGRTGGVGCLLYTSPSPRD